MLKSDSAQEQELVYEVWRTEQCKNVIMENRKLRDARYEKRRELDAQNALAREEEMLRTLDEQRRIDNDSMVQRENDLRKFKSLANREKRTDMCKMLFNEIFEIANQAWELQQKNNTSEIDQRNWNEWMKLFKHDTSIQDAFETTLDHTLAPTATTDLNDSELDDYLKNQGQWPKTLVKENPIDLESILTPDDGGKKGAKGAAPVELGEEEKKVPEDLDSN